MALFNRQKNSNVPAELQPYYDAPRSGPRGWLMWLVRIVALLIIVGALIFAGLWGWHKIFKKDAKVGTSSSTAQHSPKAKSNSSSSNPQSSTQSPATPSNGSAGSSTSSQPTSTPSPNPASSSSAEQSSPNSTALTNTGPGDTAVLFGAATIIGVALHQSYLRLKKRVSA